MSDTQNLTYEIYSHDTLAVFGDKRSYHKLMKSLGGRWNSKLKIGSGAGWILPREKQTELDEIIMTQKFSVMERNARPRQSQRKYHRSVSGGAKHVEEVGNPEEPPVEIQHTAPVPTPVQEEQPPVVVKPPPKQQPKTSSGETSLEELFQKETDPRLLNYYKKFSKSPSPSPVKKKKKSRYYSSSESPSDSDSDSDFPVFESRKKSTAKKISREIKKVAEQMQYLEHKFHKLKKKLG